MKVKNIHSGGNRKIPDGYTSWLNYWMERKGVSDTPNCANKACSRMAEHGGHIKKVGSTDNTWYIVPLCVNCNEDKDLEFETESSNLVPIN